MRFSSQTFFYYETGQRRALRVEDLFRDGNASSAGLFTLSGGSDLREALLIIDEWYRLYPVLVFKELRRSTGENPAGIDDLDHEPALGKREYNRTVELHASIKQDPAVWALGKTGNILTQNLELDLGLLQLMRADYWPAAGDQVFAFGRLHDVVSDPTTPPSDYWQGTGVPMHVHLKAEIAQYGDGEPPRQVLSLDTVFQQPAWQMAVPVAAPGGVLSPA